MLNSNKRMDFIVEYISAYEAKIKLSNKNGLFDTAKLFELFAKEICELWFGEEFINLNEQNLNYPCVDLMSSSKKVFVQVSTEKDIPNKIKKTLKSIEKNEKLPQIERLVFFDLSNETEKSVVKYSGDTRIGNIDFEPKNDFITTNKIVEKAKHDLAFQEKLYLLLTSEFNTCKTLSNALNNAIFESKEIVLKNIDTLINNEYEIDRSEIIQKISSCKSQFVCVEGNAGCGKSVLCKKAIEKEEVVLCARAERFTEESLLDDIWHLNIQKTLAYLNKKPVIFYIDSLEFIADAPKTKMDLLQSLFAVVSTFKNARIITSCRTNDKTSFIKIHSLYSVESIVVPELTDAELKDVEKVYPIIEKMFHNPAYSRLVKTPFYINLIISNISDYNSINDETQLRDYIWEKVICLKDNLSNVKYNFSDVIETINTVVFERAKEFTIGIHISKLNSDIINKLVSKGVVISNNNYIRLKYDIFEDICFEKHFDLLFDECKGIYTDFFIEIEKLGRCIYRRYQIWISNKLLNKINRDKFLYNLVFSKTTPKHWTKQTIIGLVKSRFSSAFFEEQKDNIIKMHLIEEFAGITNLYAFEANIIYNKKRPIILLYPNGAGRSSLIKIINDYKLYDSKNINSEIIKKLCSDYSKEEKYDSNTASAACAILEFYVDKELLFNNDKYHYPKDAEINSLLNPLYQMSCYSKDWIIHFWNILKDYYIDDKHIHNRLAEKIIKYTLKNTTIQLTQYIPDELCELATLFWTANSNDEQTFYRDELDAAFFEYGLNKQAARYDHSNKSLEEYHFFRNLLYSNFYKGFYWAIDFINNAIIKYVQNNTVDNLTIKFLLNENESTYYGNLNMWLAGSIEHSIPNLIGDLVYTLKHRIIDVIKMGIEFSGNYVGFANNIKQQIFSKSNNIMLLTIIEDIGIAFEDGLPGYALDLSTNINLIHWDITRFVRLNPGPESEKLKKSLFTTMGVPYLKGRYEEKAKLDFTLQEYVSHMQVCNSDTQDHCYKILDYLYSIIPNDAENASNHLQIQKMDIRSAKIERIDDNIVALKPVITGEAEKVVQNNNKVIENRIKINRIIKDFFNKSDPTSYSSDYIMEKLCEVLELCGQVETPFIYDEYIVAMMACVLNKKELDYDSRTEVCNCWLDGIEKILNNGSFNFDYNMLFVLFSQINNELNQETKNRIKRLVLILVMYNSTHGIILQLKRIAKAYLKTDEKMALLVFNTILMLAKDEMEHQLYNYNYLLNRNESVEFIPNVNTNFNKVDFYFTNHNIEGFNSKKEEIIEKFLFEEFDLKLTTFSLDNFDIRTLYGIINCGLSLKNNQFRLVVSNIVNCLLNMWNSNDARFYNEPLIKSYETYDLSDFLGSSLFEELDIVLDILFSNTDFQLFSTESVEFYQRVFGCLLPIYVDAYEDKNKRNKCEDIIYKLEGKLNSITCSNNVRYGLYKSLILSVSGYEGDWSKVKTSYSYSDISFLNKMFSKYGKYNLVHLLYTVYKMKIDLLLPEILTSIYDTIKGANDVSNTFEANINKTKPIIDYIITISFLYHSDKIKQDYELTKSYVGILETLINYGFEEAAVLLDEFLIH